MDAFTEDLQARLRSGELAATDARAAERFVARGLPTRGEEAWKYTDLAALAAQPHRLAGAADRSAPDAAAVGALDLAAELPARAIVVNGALRADLSALDALPGGVTLRAEAGAAGTGESPYVLSELNAAFADETLVLEVADGAAPTAPVHLVFVGTGTALLRLPRVEVRAGRNSTVHVVEEYVGLADDTGFTNALTRVTVDEGASVHHHRLLRESPGASHVGRVDARVAANGTFHSDAVALGGELARVDIDVALEARGARCRLLGLFVADGTRHVDHHTCIDHVAGDTHSEELYRGIVDDRARGVFNGRVVVRENAQQISARQASNNLLLSRRAEIDTKPELEIYADDVTCAHGATVGELDAAALFYLRSRGIPESDARALLTYAFAEEVIESLPANGVRDWLEHRFLGGTGLTELREALR